MSVHELRKAVTDFLREADPFMTIPALDRIQKEFVAGIAKALGSVDKEVSKALLSGQIDLDDIRRADQTVTNVFIKVRDEFDSAYTRYVLRAGSIGRDSAVREFGLGLDFGLVNEVAQRELTNHAFKASQLTMDRMVGDVMGTLRDGHSRGLGIYEMRSEIAKDFTHMKSYELDRISRTELHSASQKGADLAYGEAGVDFDKWVTARDERVRGEEDDSDHDHTQMEGQIVRHGDPFRHPIDGWEMLYPGDRDHGAPIGTWINCRCRKVPYWMPKGKAAPSNMKQFYEEDLIPAA